MLSFYAEQAVPNWACFAQRSDLRLSLYSPFFINLSLLIRNICLGAADCYQHALWSQHSHSCHQTAAWAYTMSWALQSCAQCPQIRISAGCSTAPPLLQSQPCNYYHHLAYFALQQWAVRFTNGDSFIVELPCSSFVVCFLVIVYFTFQEKVWNTL